MTIEIKRLTTKYRTIIIGLGYNISDNEEKIVSKISYCRKGYNKGYQGDFPAYKIDFEDSPLRVIIPERVIEHLLVEKIEKVKKTIPELPDDTPEEEEPHQLKEVEMPELPIQVTNTSPEKVNMFKPIDELDEL